MEYLIKDLQFTASINEIESLPTVQKNLIIYSHSVYIKNLPLKNICYEFFICFRKFLAEVESFIKLGEFNVLFF